MSLMFPKLKILNLKYQTLKDRVIILPTYLACFLEDENLKSILYTLLALFI